MTRRGAGYRRALRYIRQGREALRTLGRRPLRSILIGAGVAVAVGALLVAETVAERGRLDTVNEIRRMGANVVIISAQWSQNRGGRPRTGSEVTTLTLEDARDLASSIAGVAAISSEYKATAPVKAGDLARQASIGGVDASYAKLRDSPMALGHFFEEADAVSAQRVVVLGAQLARDLFGDANPVEQVLWVRRIPFRIVGVLPSRGTGVDAFDEDEVAFVPLRTAQRRLFQVNYVQRVFVRIDESGTTLDQAVLAITALLRTRHHGGNDTTRFATAADFRVDTQIRLVDMRATSVRRLCAFEVGVAVLLLVAGAGGTFALQHLVVRERTTEVGTRRALGATTRDVFVQFFIEASVESGVGGALGIALARLTAYITKVTLPPGLAPAVFATCVVSCISAACIPVWRAARLHPAEALRTS
ncbi:MAG: ABC transporter permease [Gemmatimonadaceae bacterium]